MPFQMISCAIVSSWEKRHGKAVWIGHRFGRTSCLFQWNEVPWLGYLHSGTCTKISTPTCLSFQSPDNPKLVALVQRIWYLNKPFLRVRNKKSSVAHSSSTGLGKTFGFNSSLGVVTYSRSNTSCQIPENVVVFGVGGATSPKTQPDDKFKNNNQDIWDEIANDVSLSSHNDSPLSNPRTFKDLGLIGRLRSHSLDSGAPLLPPPYSTLNSPTDPTSSSCPKKMKPSKYHNRKYE